MDGRTLRVTELRALVSAPVLRPHRYWRRECPPFFQFVPLGCKALRSSRASFRCTLVCLSTLAWARSRFLTARASWVVWTTRAMQRGPSAFAPRRDRAVLERTDPIHQQCS